MDAADFMDAVDAANAADMVDVSDVAERSRGAWDMGKDHRKCVVT